MNLILKWTMAQLMGLFVGVFTLAQSMSTSAFANPVVRALMTSFQSLGLPLLGIAMLVKVVRMIIDVMDGKSIDVGDTIVRLLLGSLIHGIGVNTMKYLYLAILETGSSVIKALTDSTDITKNLWEDLLTVGDINTLFILILMLVAIYFMLKTVFSLLERFWLFLMTLLMLYLYIPGYISGNDESLILWFKQCIGYALTQIMQTLILVLGMNMFISGGSGAAGLSSFALAIGAIIGASKADQVLDKWGQGSGGKLGNVARNGMSSVYYAKSLFAK